MSRNSPPTTISQVREIVPKLAELTEKERE